jgi:hypothetical protein
MKLFVVCILKPHAQSLKGKSVLKTSDGIYTHGKCSACVEIHLRSEREFRLHKVSYYRMLQNVYKYKPLTSNGIVIMTRNERKIGEEREREKINSTKIKGLSP